MNSLVAVLDELERCRGEIIDLGTDVTHTTGEGMKMVEEIIGKEARIKDMPRRPGDQLRTRANIGKARSLLGYRPGTTLREGLEKEVAWYRDDILGKITLW